MNFKPFHDLSISALGFGSLRLPLEEGSKTRIDRSRAQRVLDCALAAGINYIDTAYTYNQGDSECFLGEALKRHPRNSYLLATKFYAAASRDIRAVFEEQLRRCQTDYFDFYLLHSLDENYIHDYMDPNLDYIGFLKEQKRLGRIRYLGFSSHAQPDTLEKFLNWYDGFDMAQIQLNYLDWDLLNARRQYEILMEHQIPVWVMEPLKGGNLVTLNQEAAGILRSFRPEFSLPEWSFRFLMGLSGVQTVLSGMSTEKDVEENVRIFSEGSPLTDEENAVLKKAADAYVRRMGIPCSACRYCCSVCPAGLDIPALIRSYNEFCISGETWKVSGIRSLTGGPDKCIGCERCMRRCPQKIAIPEVMKAFSAALK